MAKNVTTYRILISSPGDVLAERDIVEEVINNDIGPKLRRHHAITLEAVRWEKHGWPFIGEIQDELFRQLGEYDAFVGIFWMRYGTPSGEYDSGSKAEFLDALKRWKKDNAFPILMYFCERDLEMDYDADPEVTMENLRQFQKVKAFRKELEGKGLYWAYTEPEDFRHLVSTQLYKALDELIKQNPLTSVPDSLGPGAASEPMEGALVHEPASGSKELATTSPPGARPRYLKALRRDCLQIPLTVMGEDAGTFRRAVTLDQVFISLMVTEKKLEHLKEADHWLREEDSEPLTALEAIQPCTEVVLLGDPGSGKSSLVRHLLAGLVDHELEGHPLPLPGTEGLLPVQVVLRDLAPALGAATVPEGFRDRQKSLADLIVAQAVAGVKYLGVPEFAAGIQQAFVEEKVFLVLDGLDEVPYKLRGLVREAVNAALNRFNLPRVIVTCRIRSYTGAAVFDDVKTFTLAKLNEERIASFIGSWYDAQCELGRVKQGDREVRVTDLTGVATSEPLLSLARNPMLLTTMTIIHQQEAVLPKERVKLYQKAVDLLLKRWQQGKGGLPKELVNLIDNREEKMRPVMERLAFQAHGTGANDEAADLSRTEIIELLSEPIYLGHESLASQFLDYVDLRSGLLVGRGGTPERPTVYSFPHRTFQEYLAGCYIIGARGAAGRLKELAQEGDFWSEAVLLGIEEQVYNSGSYGQNHVLNLAGQLSRSKPETEAESRLTLWLGKMAEVVGADVVVQDPGDLEPGSEVLNRLRSQFVGLLSGALPVKERAEAGRTLARLGDPREELMTLEHMPFCYVPSGPFLMGSTDEDEMAAGDEKPQKSVDLPYDYWISQYPVTQAQFRVFVEDGGYEDKKLWTKEGLEFIYEKKIVAPEKRGEPYDLANHPVIGVSWYEALAFTKWLTRHGRASGWLSEEGEIVLPNEPEWEKAARGGLQIPVKPYVSSLMSIVKESDPEIKTNETPGNLYPWGDELTMQHANYREPGIGTTMTPGSFPPNKSVYGVVELSGNVDEWTRSVWDTEPYQNYKKAWTEREDLGSGSYRVFRGGSWYGSAGALRSAYRSIAPPGNRDGVLGFRVVRTAQ